jgi:hypothetical protein
VIDGNLAREAMMAVPVGDITLVLDVPTLTTKLALTQEVAKSRIVVLTSTPFAKRFAARGFLSPWVFEDVHPFKSNSVGEACAATKSAAYIGIDHVGNTKGGVRIG